MELTEAINHNAESVVNWCLSIIGGSILVLISSGFIRPKNKKIRVVYLLFLPGWFFLGYTIKLGVDIGNSGIMSTLMINNENERLLILANMGNIYTSQLFYFNIGLFFFGIWLLVFLIFWVFGKDQP